ncbi:unnamed protein product [Linum trigynum]|uniref:Uncharacterized protein n=1 Tax=Linum trigynum TaxID=586398 RepID=A0AAV2G8E5_9ROSI
MHALPASAAHRTGRTQPTILLSSPLLPYRATAELGSRWTSKGIRFGSLSIFFLLPKEVQLQQRWGYPSLSSKSAKSDGSSIVEWRQMSG